MIQGYPQFRNPPYANIQTNSQDFRIFRFQNSNIYIYRSDPIRPLQFVAANIGDSFTSEGYLKMMGKIAFPAQFLACLSLGEHEVAGFFKYVLYTLPEGFWAHDMVMFFSPYNTIPTTFSIHQWVRSAIRDSQQPNSSIGFLF